MTLETAVMIGAAIVVVSKVKPIIEVAIDWAKERREQKEKSHHAT